MSRAYVGGNLNNVAPQSRREDFKNPSTLRERKKGPEGPSSVLFLPVFPSSAIPRYMSLLLAARNLAIPPAVIRTPLFDDVIGRPGVGGSVAIFIPFLVVAVAVGLIGPVGMWRSFSTLEDELLALAELTAMEPVLTPRSRPYLPAEPDSGVLARDESSSSVLVTGVWERLGAERVVV